MFSPYSAKRRTSDKDLPVHEEVPSLKVSSRHDSTKRKNQSRFECRPIIKHYFEILLIFMWQEKETSKLALL